MTKKSSGTPKRVPTGDYKNGYARAPESGKIKPGEIRNPYGRTGKPKEEFDSFEYAMSRPMTIKIDGETVTLPAEAVMHIKQAASALAGNHAPYKTIVEERRARRNRQKLALARDEVEADAREMEQKKQLSARIVGFMTEFANAKKEREQQAARDAAEDRK